MSWPREIGIVADQCLRSWSRQRPSTPARSRVRHHHASVRSGFTGRFRTFRVQGPRFRRTRFNCRTALAVVPSGVTVLRSAVLVGSSWSVGYFRSSGDPWRAMAALLRFPPRTDRLTRVRRPMASRPVDARASLTPGDRSRRVVTGPGQPSRGHGRSKIDHSASGTGERRPTRAAPWRSPPAGSGWCPRRSG
jgi:hypothetical protein